MTNHYIPWFLTRKVTVVQMETLSKSEQMGCLHGTFQAEIAIVTTLLQPIVVLGSGNFSVPGATERRHLWPQLRGLGLYDLRLDRRRVFLQRHSVGTRTAQQLAPIIGMGLRPSEPDDLSNFDCSKKTRNFHRWTAAI